jgi:hypothetical protein
MGRFAASKPSSPPPFIYLLVKQSSLVIFVFGILILVLIFYFYS